MWCGRELCWQPYQSNLYFAFRHYKLLYRPTTRLAILAVLLVCGSLGFEREGATRLHYKFGDACHISDKAASVKGVTEQVVLIIGVKNYRYQGLTLTRTLKEDWMSGQRTKRKRVKVSTTIKLPRDRLAFHGWNMFDHCGRTSQTQSDRYTTTLGNQRSRILLGTLTNVIASLQISCPIFRDPRNTLNTNYLVI